MPNGGPDNCANCAFNKAVQKMDYPYPFNDDQMKRFYQLSYCTLRDVKITSPFWTYCDNFRSEEELSDQTKKVKIIGWIFANGLYEGYVRIPWDGNIEPVAYRPCVCLLCGRKTNTGITVTQDSKEIGFCSNRHYIYWWKTKHDDPAIESEYLRSPEELYKKSK
jgi:hypothetical protein